MTTSELSIDDDDANDADFDIFVDHVTRRVEIVGELDIATVPHLLDAAGSLQTTPAREITIDLDSVTFIDAAAFGVLVGLSNVQREQGAALYIVANDRVKRLAGLCGLDELLAVD